jgi:hypothetical protein
MVTRRKEQRENLDEQLELQERLHEDVAKIVYVAVACPEEDLDALEHMLERADIIFKQVRLDEADFENIERLS